MSICTGVIIEFVDGSMLPFDGERYVADYERAAVGRSGKSLIQALFTNDWGAPPARLKVVRDGKSVATVEYK